MSNGDVFLEKPLVLNTYTGRLPLGTHGFLSNVNSDCLLVTHVDFASSKCFREKYRLPFKSRIH